MSYPNGVARSQYDNYASWENDALPTTEQMNRATGSTPPIYNIAVVGTINLMKSLAGKQKLTNLKK